jgi:hypothetical protein
MYFTLRWMLFCLLWGGMALLSLSNRDPWSFSTTTWLPGGLLLAVLMMSRLSLWPVWLVTALLLHTLCGLYSGRPLILAALFALFDAFTLPLCALALRYVTRCERSEGVREPLLALTSLIAIVFGSGLLLMLCLKVLGDDISLFHLVSWSLALLTSLLAFWPLTDALNREGKALVAGRRRNILATVGMLVLLLMLFLPSWRHLSPMLYGFNPIWLIFTGILLLALVLEPRVLGAVMLLQYLLVIGATLYERGLFVGGDERSLSAIWNAQWYLLFCSWLGFTTNRFARHTRRLKNQLQQRARIDNALAPAAATALFRLYLTDRRLIWQTPPDAFFGDEYSVTTLSLLEARSVSPFDADLEPWIAGGREEPFRTRIALLLDGAIVRCRMVLLGGDSRDEILGGLAVEVAHPRGGE